MEENHEKISHKRLISRLSKYLTLILRHKPEILNMTLDELGWSSLNLDELVSALTQDDRFSWVTREAIEEVVNTDPKGRYQISETDPMRIRATYGHSIGTIELLDNPTPAEELPNRAFFGCSDSELSSILRLGISTSERQYIHLSVRKNDALAIARKKFPSEPRIISIDLAGIATSGIPCKAVTPHVIIVELIPSQFISEIPVPERFNNRSRRFSNKQYDTNTRKHSPNFHSSGASKKRSFTKKFPKDSSKTSIKGRGKRKSRDSDSLSDFDDEIEFVFKKDSKKSDGFSDDEITDEDFDFEIE